MARKQPDAINNIVITLQKEILSGVYGKSGSGIMPPTSNLQERFKQGTAKKAGRETITRAMQHLRAMGLVVPRGRNIIIDTPDMELPGVVPDFSEHVELKGLTPAIENVGDPAKVTLNEEQAIRFNLPANTKTLKRLRLQGAKQGKYTSWYRLAETFYLEEMVREDWIHEVIINPKFNIIREIEKKTGKKITHAHSKLKVRFPTQEEQELLTITYETPVIEHFRTCYSADDTLIMFNRILLVANKFILDFDYDIAL